MNSLDSAKVRTSFFLPFLCLSKWETSKACSLHSLTRLNEDERGLLRLFFSPLLVQLIASILGRYVFKIFEWVLRKVISEKLIWTLFAEYPFDLNQHHKFDQYKIDAQLWSHDWQVAYLGTSWVSYWMLRLRGNHCLTPLSFFFFFCHCRDNTVDNALIWKICKCPGCSIRSKLPPPLYILWLSEVLIISKLIMQTARFCREFGHHFH